MERLTEKITNKETGEVLAYRTLPNVSNLKVTQQLGKYEDTGLTTEQVQELKERDTAKRPIEHVPRIGFPYYECPTCRNIDVFEQEFCDECGQRLDWSNE